MAPKKKFTVTVLPDQVKISASYGANLLDALTGAGIALDASCGGAGVCGQCRVRLREGEVDAQPGARQSLDDYEAGWRQACRSDVVGDVVIEIPEESRIEAEVIVARRPPPSGQYLSKQKIESLNKGYTYDPTLKKIFLKLPPPTADDNVPDMTRLARQLRRDHGIKHLQVDLEVLRALPDRLRQSRWEVTVTLIYARAQDAFVEPRERGAHRPMLIRVESGDTTRRHFALALDIGTTTVSGQVLDLATGNELCTVNEWNSQAQYGADVISRIMYALKPGGLATLQARVVETINKVIGHLAENCGVDPHEINHLTAAGNTTMTHLLLRLNPKWLRESPYVPVINRAGAVNALELGINAGPWARFYTFPCVASYVGGDIIAGVLATGIYKRETTALFIDIGTNAEIVIGNKDFLLSASASAGPAFEGGGISCGMHAGSGAIERFKIDPATCEARFDTIRYRPARGVCGSGLINVIAAFLEAGLIEPNGKINTAAETAIVREGRNGPEIVIAPAAKTELGIALYLNEGDINNLLRAKAAMYAGYSTLLEHVGMTFDDIEDVFIAGNFGNSLEIENAITIGLLPDINRAKFKFVGNASLLGARMLYWSGELLHDAEILGRMMTNVEFWDNHRFMEQYMAAMFFPHTDLNRFPNVSGRIAAGRNKCRRQAAGGRR
jgi:uncharacterized 2Fe-2S/4Fe-4S cluster protein (DUF4445 family)